MRAILTLGVERVGEGRDRGVVKTPGKVKRPGLLGLPHATWWPELSWAVR